MSDDGNADIALLFGFGGGLYYFYHGFRVFREYRVLMDTPEIPIRSMAMGLVHVHGKARAPQTVTSPVTRTPCYFYKIDIESWVRDKNGGHWSHVATDADGVRFYLEDASGKVLVDAHNAEYDLLKSARVEARRGGGQSLGRLLGGIDDPAATAVSNSLGTDLYSYAQMALARRGISHSFDARDFVSSLAAKRSMGEGPDRYRLSEYMILPDHWYDLTGTCTENPAPQDEHDRNLVAKGTNEPTFLISWQSEKEIERTLRKRAALHILGGGAAAVACLGILLAKYGAF